MTKNEVISLAQECGKDIGQTCSLALMNVINAAYEAGVKSERTECADMVLTLTCMGNAKECFETAAAYIRARGQA